MWRGAAARWRRWGTAATASRASADQLGAGLLARRPAGLGAGASGEHRRPEHRAGRDRHDQGAVRDRAGDPGRRPGDDHRRARGHAQRTRRRVRLRAEDRADPQADRRGRSAAVAVRPDQPRRDHLRQSSPASGWSCAATRTSPPSAPAKREELLAATERELEKVKQMVEGPRGTLSRRRRREDRGARRPRDQQVQGRQTLRDRDRRRLLHLPAQDRTDRPARPRSTGSTC